MKCPHCQYDNPEGSQFCGDCGQSLETEPVCSKCRHINPRSQKFCNKCGHILTNQSSVSTPGASTQPTPQPTISPAQPTQEQPASFVSGRYQVKQLLGEGNDKTVYLAHDTQTDRNVAFALLKIEKPEVVTRGRITREAVAFALLKTDRLEDTKNRIRELRINHN